MSNKCIQIQVHIFCHQETAYPLQVHYSMKALWLNKENGGVRVLALAGTTFLSSTNSKERKQMVHQIFSNIHKTEYKIDIKIILPYPHILKR